MIDEEHKIKLFDLLIKDLTTPTGFNVCIVLTENNHLKVDTPEQIEYFSDLEDTLKDFGISRGYFEIKGNNGWLKLTDKGIKLKDYQKGYLKYEKSLRTRPLDWYKIILILLTLLFGSSTFYFANINNNLSMDAKSENTRNSELANENIYLKNTIDSLNYELIKHEQKNIDLKQLPVE